MSAAPVSARTWSPGLAVVAALTLAACSGPDESAGPATASSSADTTTAPASVETVAEGLQAPWSVAFHEGTTLVSERDSGRIVEVDEGGSQREVGAIDGATPSGEGGLLGITVHEGYLYVYFTAGDENRVARYLLTGAPGSLGLGGAETVLDGAPAASYHNGGRISFGPDGMLYVSVGDAGNRADAQDTESLSGKILRLTPEGHVPEDNPFDGSPVYSFGHRNPQGLAWDQNGTMYSSEFGQATWDELNVIEAGGNYGWPEVEGIAGEPGYIDPVQQWTPAEASPSGMTISDGSIWIANLRGERLREIPLQEPSTSTQYLVGEHGRLRDVTVTPEGSLWALTNNTDGRGEPGPDDDRILEIDPRG